MSEPQLDDPIALGDDEVCEDCDCLRDECACSEPDVMYADFYED